MPERYDQSLHYARDLRLPPEAPRPKPTCDWPRENVDLLERFAGWLRGGGASEYVIRTVYIPMAGHVLGLALKPHPQLDLYADLFPALECVVAKGVGEEWTKVCRNALARFRRFLLHERGQVEIRYRPYDIEPHTQDLPAWLVEALTRYQRLMQCNWREARIHENIRRFWSGHLRVWRFLVERCGVRELADVRRKQLFDYIDHRLAAGSSVATINADLRYSHSFLAFLQEQGYAIPQALLRIRSLKQPDRLPQFLTDDQVCALRDDFEGRLACAIHPYQRRDALLDRAIFYLLWQCGLRKGEVEELRLEDLELSNRRLSVRNGKGLKDRTVYLTDTVVRALVAYLAVRGSGPTDHVFLYRNQPLGKDLIHGRLKAAGERVGVKVHAHRLRHTTATQLLNAGCPVTSIQKFLGHKKLNTTMIYARAHDQTMEADYFAAMGRIEQRLELIGEKEATPETLGENERHQLLALARRLSEPELGREARLALASVMLALLNGREAVPGGLPPEVRQGGGGIPPPLTPALVSAESVQ